MLNIRLNGEAQSFPEHTSISQVIEVLGLSGKRIAVECNGEIVPKSLHSSHLLKDGDRIEIVSAVGGG